MTVLEIIGLATIGVLAIIAFLHATGAITITINWDDE